MTVTLPYYVTYKQLPEVIGVTWSRVHLREMVNQGKFPAPYQVTPKRIAWRHSELIEWAEKRELRSKCLADSRAERFARKRRQARNILAG